MCPVNRMDFIENIEMDFDPGRATSLYSVFSSILSDFLSMDIVSLLQHYQNNPYITCIKMYRL